jgi:hypothetical protein
MPETVYEWTWGGSPGRVPDIPATPNPNHQCESVSHPEINSTAPSQEWSRNLFVDAWNSTYGTSLTVNDFTFMPKPE